MDPVTQVKLAEHSRFGWGWGTFCKVSILFNFLFPLVPFNSVFLTLKCGTLVLKTTAWRSHGSHLVENWYISLRCENIFFYCPLKNHQMYAKRTDSDCSIIPKSFWKNRGQKNSFGEEGRNSFSCAKIKAGFGWLAVIELTFSKIWSKIMHQLWNG